MRDEEGGGRVTGMEEDKNNTGKVMFGITLSAQESQLRHDLV